MIKSLPSSILSIAAVLLLAVAAHAAPPAPAADAVVERPATGGTIRGVVVDDEGKPLSGVRVGCSLKSSDAAPGDATLTDKNGRFQSRSAPLDALIDVSFEKDLYELQTPAETLSVILTIASPERDLHVVMCRLPTGAITGCVVDTSNRPIVGARLDIWNFKETFATDAEGRFRTDEFPIIVFGSKSLGVTAKGFAPQTLQPEPGTAEHPGDITIKLEPGHNIHGRIVDDRGNPVAGATIVVRSRAYLTGESREHPRTDDQGRFAIDSLPANAQLSLQTPAGPYLNSMHLKLDSPQEAIYKLEAPGVIRARVVDGETRKPLRQFHVRLFYWEPREGNELAGPMYYNGRWSDPGVTIDANDGRVRIEPLRYGRRQDLIVEAEGYERTVVPDIVPQHSEQANEVKIVMLPIHSPDYSTLRGQVLDDEGRGIAGVQLRLMVALKPLNDYFTWRGMKFFDRESYIERFEAAVTDADGRFGFAKIIPGRFVAIAYWNTDVPKNCWFANDKTLIGKDTAVTIHAPKPARIYGTIERAGFPGALMVTLSRKNDPYYLEYGITLGANQQKFEFADLGPNDYRVDLWRAHKESKNSSSPRIVYQVRITLKSGGAREIDFRAPLKPE